MRRSFFFCVVLFGSMLIGLSRLAHFSFTGRLVGKHCDMQYLVLTNEIELPT